MIIRNALAITQRSRHCFGARCVAANDPVLVAPACQPKVAQTETGLSGSGGAISACSSLSGTASEGGPQVLGDRTL